MLGRQLARIHGGPSATRARSGRETFIALRACRRAWELARGIHSSRPIDVTHLYCQACGTPVDCSNINDPTGPRCPSCGTAVRVPGYIRGAVRTIDPELEQQLRRYEHILHIFDPENLDDSPRFDEPAVVKDLTETAALVRLARAEDQSLEKVEWTFLKLCALIVLTFMALGTLLLICLFLFASVMKSSGH